MFALRLVRSTVVFGTLGVLPATSTHSTETSLHACTSASVTATTCVLVDTLGSVNSWLLIKVNVEVAIFVATYGNSALDDVPPFGFRTRFFIVMRPLVAGVALGDGVGVTVGVGVGVGVGVEI